ncbi:uncharacterized protein [Littorina saxatilis]
MLTETCSGKTAITVTERIDYFTTSKMKLDKGDLDNTVVEDGEAAVILKSDSPTVTAKNKVTDKASNRTQLPNGCRKMTGQEKSQQNGGVTVETKQRVPVEDSEEDDSAKENGGEDLDVLTNSLRGCSIQESAKLGIEDQLAQLAVEDKEEEDDDDDDNTQYNSLQSQSSVIAIDPPSLPHEEEEEKGEAAEDLAPRGPTAGKPVSFRPDNNNYNHIASKAYGSHNMDRFYAQATFSPNQHPQAAGFSQNDFMQNGLSQPAFYNMGQVTNGGVGQMYTSGKRGMDDDDENAFKYTRPVEDVGYSPTANFINDLNGGMKKPSIINQSQRHGCGGQMVDNSPEILPPSAEPFKHLQAQISLTDVDRMLDLIESQDQLVSHGYQPHLDFGVQMTQTEKVGTTARKDYDPGYSSENSPHSDNMVSPGSSPKSTFSPGRPPSNMSHDSGIASPFSNGIPSPPEDYSQGRNLVPTADEYSPYSMADSSQSAVYRSPYSNAMSPYSNAVSPHSNAMSPHSNAMSPHSNAMSPHSNAMSPYSNTMSPPSTINTDDLSMTSAHSPVAATVLCNGDFLAGRKDELLDALDVVAKDMKAMCKNKASTLAPSHKINNVAPIMSTAPVSVSTPNVPLSVVAQQKNDRPAKLPIPPLAKQQQPQQSMMPVMVVPTTANGHAMTTHTPVTSSQPVLLMPQGQTPLIVVLNSTSAPPHQANKKRQPVPIQPRPGPAIAPAPSMSAGANNRTVPKPEPSVPSPRPQGSVMAVPAGQKGVRPTPCPLPAAAQSTPGKKSRNPAQPTMLTIARRLVASMKTGDLSFQDAEGDTYLLVSVCKADCNMVQALLERMSRENLQPLINTQNNMRQTPLYLAVSSNAPEMVELLIRYNADVNVFAEHTMADGRTKEIKAALHCAASHGEEYLATLQALLAARELNIDQVNSDGHTALHCAILEHGKPGSEGGVINNLPIIQALIKHGADPNAQGKKSGKTALMYALESRDISLIENIVALIDPARLRTYLKSQAFDGSTCLRINENIQRGLDEASRQRLNACLKINGRRDNSAS